MQTYCRYFFDRGNFTEVIPESLDLGKVVFKSSIGMQTVEEETVSSKLDDLRAIRILEAKSLNLL